MPEITMPRLSDSMEEGTILKWLKSDGDEVSEGDELAEIETDKATMTYEADAAGVLEIVAEEGQTLAIGEVIAKLKGEGDSEESSSDEDEEPTTTRALGGRGRRGVGGRGARRGRGVRRGEESEQSAESDEDEEPDAAAKSPTRTKSPPTTRSPRRSPRRPTTAASA